MIAIGSVVSPIRSPDITTNQDGGGEYETTVNKRNKSKQCKIHRQPALMLSCRTIVRHRTG